MYRDKRSSGVYIVPTSLKNKKDEKIYEVYSQKKEIMDSRLSLQTFKAMNEEEIEKQKPKLGAYPVKRFGVRTNNDEEWIDLVKSEDKITRVDYNNDVETFSPSFSNDDKFHWVVNSAGRADAEAILNAAQYLSEDQLKLLINVYAKYNIKRPLANDAIENLKSYRSKESLKSIIHNLAENPNYTVMNPEKTNFELSRKFAAMLSRKIVDVYKGRGMNGPLKFRVQDVKKYVERILAKKETFFANTEIAGMNINTLLDEVTHRNSQSVQDLLAKVLFDTIQNPDPEKQQLFAKGDDFKKPQGKVQKTDYFKTLVKDNINDIQKETKKYLDKKGAKIELSAADSLLKQLEDQYDSDPEFKELLQDGVSRQNLIKYVAEFALKGTETDSDAELIVKLAKRVDSPPDDLSTLDQVRQFIGTIPTKLSLYDYFVDDRNSNRLEDVREMLAERGATMDTHQILESLRRMPEDTSQAMRDGGYFDNQDVVTWLMKNKFFLSLKRGQSQSEEEGQDAPQPQQASSAPEEPLPEPPVETNRVSETPEKAPKPDDERILLHENVINRVSLKSTKFGMESGDDLKKSPEEIKKEERVWYKTLQHVDPGFGLLQKGRNVIYEQNLRRDANNLKGPLLAVGSRDELKGITPPATSSFHPSPKALRAPEGPLRAPGRSADELVIDLLKRELLSTTMQLSKALREPGAPGMHDEADNQDRTEKNSKRPSKDIFEPVLREGNVGHKRKLMPAYDLAGRTHKMQSVFERGIDKRFVHY